MSHVQPNCSVAQPATTPFTDDSASSRTSRGEMGWPPPDARPRTRHNPVYPFEALQRGCLCVEETSPAPASVLHVPWLTASTRKWRARVRLDDWTKRDGWAWRGGA